MPRLAEVFLTALRLGCTSFGGPVAHVGYFHSEYVEKKKWVDERSFALITAVAHILPGPTSSQIGIAVGLARAGFAGGIAAWAGFTFPTALILGLFAWSYRHWSWSGAGWIHGLKLTALAVVAQAVIALWRRFARTAAERAAAVFACAASLLFASPYTGFSLIVIGALLFAMTGRNHAGPDAETLADKEAEDRPVTRTAGLLLLALFALLLFSLPGLRDTHPLMALVDSFFRAGSVVFGGGHAVLPLVEAELVPRGFLTREDFLAGYGAAQAMPGPLFAFASYAGAAASIPGSPALHALVCTLAIFLPGFLLMAGIQPFWSLLENPRMKSAASGASTAVVGILAAALVDPLWTSSVRGPFDAAAAFVLFALLIHWKLPSWAAALFGAAAGLLIESSGFH